MGSIQPLTEMTAKKFSGGKIRTGRAAENSADTMLLNVEVRDEAQLSITFLSLLDLLEETFTFISIKSHEVIIRDAQRQQV